MTRSLPPPDTAPRATTTARDQLWVKTPTRQAKKNCTKLAVIPWQWIETLANSTVVGVLTVIAGSEDHVRERNSLIVWHRLTCGKDYTTKEIFRQVKFRHVDDLPQSALAR